MIWRASEVCTKCTVQVQDVKNMLSSRPEQAASNLSWFKHLVLNQVFDVNSDYYQKPRLSYPKKAVNDVVLNFFKQELLPFNHVGRDQFQTRPFLETQKFKKDFAMIQTLKGNKIK